MPKTNPGSLPTHRPTGIPQPVENYDTLETAYAKLLTVIRNLNTDRTWADKAAQTLKHPDLYNLNIELQMLIQRYGNVVEDIRAKAVKE